MQRPTDPSTTAGDDLPPNHHADHAGFAGVGGYVAALTMLVGRRAVARLAVDLTRVGPDDHVVDVGCGPGTAARHVARNARSVTGVDPSAEMLRVATVLDRQDQVAWMPGRAEELPLSDGDVSVVWSLATVHHWPDLEAGLAEVRRVLAPGGRFLAVERRSHPGATGLASHGWTDGQAERFATICRAAQFSDVEVRRHPIGRAGHLSVLAHLST